MALAMKLAIFTILFNLSCGMLGVALGGFYPDGDLQIGYTYDETKNTQNYFNGSVSAPGAETSSGWWIKFVDFISIGYYQKIQAFLDNTLYGILGIFKGLGIMDPAYNSFWYSAITTIYILGVVEIFTGKRLAAMRY
jgi:hypothetical protein